MKSCANKECDNYDAETINNCNTTPYAEECDEYKPLMKEQAASSSLSSAGLARLVRLRPQVGKVEHGKEPSIKQLIMDYYKDHDMEDAEQLTNYYISELGKMAG